MKKLFMFFALFLASFLQAETYSVTVENKDFDTLSMTILAISSTEEPIKTELTLEAKNTTQTFTIEVEESPLLHIYAVGELSNDDTSFTGYTGATHDDTPDIEATPMYTKRTMTSLSSTNSTITCSYKNHRMNIKFTNNYNSTQSGS